MITRFGVPQTIVSDNGPSFLGEKVTEMAIHYGIYWKTSSNYYPQGNGLAESTNKNLMRILRRMVGDNARTWHTLINQALWADRLTVKSATKTSPYLLVYGLKARLPIHLEYPALRILQQYSDDIEPLQVRMNELLRLEEVREESYKENMKRQEVVKRWFDKKKASAITFREGDMVLRWDENRAKPG